jgi:membrane protease YdiL (CAAX protease family)
MTKRLRRYDIALFTVLFYFLWTMAWAGSDWIGAQGIWGLLGNQKEAQYWLGLRIFIWGTLPVVYFYRLVPSFPEFIGLQRRTLWKGLTAGLGCGVLWMVIQAATRFSLNDHVFRPDWDSLSFWDSVLLAPVLSELVFRGCILPGLLSSGWKFWHANVVTTILFVGIHMLGWTFRGELLGRVLSPEFAGLLSLSLLLGYVRYLTGSLLAPMFIHVGSAFTAKSLLRRL